MENKEKKIRTYAFDFDGVVAKYDGFKGHEHQDEPISEVVKAIRFLKEKGHKILIYSTRGSKFLQEYCKKYDIPVDYFNENPNYKTDGHKPVAYVYIDDRAVLYKGQKAEKLVEEIEDFKAYWE